MFPSKIAILYHVSRKRRESPEAKISLQPNEYLFTNTGYFQLEWIQPGTGFSVGLAVVPGTGCSAGDWLHCRGLAALPGTGCTAGDWLHCRGLAAVLAATFPYRLSRYPVTELVPMTALAICCQGHRQSLVSLSLRPPKYALMSGYRQTDVH